jgi:TolA-binding protein
MRSALFSRLRPLVAALATAALTLGAASAADAQSREQQQTLAELRILQEQTAQLQQAVNLLVEQMKELKESVKTVTSRLDSQSDQAIKNTADIRDVITTLSRTVSTLDQRVGENNIRVQQVEQEIAPIRQGLTKLSDALAQALQQLPPGTAGVPPAGGATGGTDLAPPTSPNDAFDQAMGFYMTSQYDLAIKAFKEYLQQFPTAPNACKAQYQLGETHFAQNKFAEAVADYDVVIKQYKGTDCEPDAYFRQGKAYEQLKQLQKAVLNYEYIRKAAADKPSEAWQNDDALARQALNRLNIKG